MKKICYTFIIVLGSASCDDASVNYFSIEGSWHAQHETYTGCTNDAENGTKLYKMIGCYQDTCSTMRFLPDRVVYVRFTEESTVSVKELNYSTQRRSLYDGTLTIFDGSESEVYNYHLAGRDLILSRSNDGKTGCSYEGTFRRGSW